MKYTQLACPARVVDFTVCVPKTFYETGRRLTRERPVSTAGGSGTVRVPSANLLGYRDQTCQDGTNRCGSPISEMMGRNSLDGRTRRVSASKGRKYWISKRLDQVKIDWGIWRRDHSQPIKIALKMDVSTSNDRQISYNSKTFKNRTCPIGL